MVSIYHRQTLECDHASLRSCHGLLSEWQALDLERSRTQCFCQPSVRSCRLYPHMLMKSAKSLPKGPHVGRPAPVILWQGIRF